MNASNAAVACNLREVVDQLQLLAQVDPLAGNWASSIEILTGLLENGRLEEFKKSLNLLESACELSKTHVDGSENGDHLREAGFGFSEAIAAAMKSLTGGSQRPAVNAAPTAAIASGEIEVVELSDDEDENIAAQPSEAIEAQYTTPLRETTASAAHAAAPATPQGHAATDPTDSIWSGWEPVRTPITTPQVEVEEWEEDEQGNIVPVARFLSGTSGEGRIEYYRVGNVLYSRSTGADQPSSPITDSAASAARTPSAHPTLSMLEKYVPTAQPLAAAVAAPPSPSGAAPSTTISEDVGMSESDAAADEQSIAAPTPTADAAAAAAIGVDKTSSEDESAASPAQSLSSAAERTPLRRKRVSFAASASTPASPAAELEKCSICGKTYKSVLSLLKHQTDVHTGTTCPLIRCGKSYKREGKCLLNHLIDHAKEIDEERRIAQATTEESTGCDAKKSRCESPEH